MEIIQEVTTDELTRGFAANVADMLDEIGFAANGTEDEAVIALVEFGIHPSTAGHYAGLALALRQEVLDVLAWLANGGDEGTAEAERL